MIENEDDAITAGSNQLDNNIVPIFCASSVTGDGLTLLKKFLFVLPPRMSNKEKEKLEQVLLTSGIINTRGGKRGWWEVRM